MVIVTKIDKLLNTRGMEMKKLVCALGLTIAIILTLPNVSKAQDYLLGPRDVIAISAWGFDELQLKDLVIRDDGKIAFPLVGDIEARGLTPNELSQKITLGLTGYVNNPVVTVNVTKPRPNRIYVLGEVTRPGLYELEGSHRLLDAVGIANGYTRNTAKRRVIIIRKDSVDKPLQVDLWSLLKNGDATQNYVLNDGDTVFFADNHRIDFGGEILPYLNSFLYMRSVINN